MLLIQQHYYPMKFRNGSVQKEMTKLYILNGPDIGKVFDIEKDAIYIGRSPDNDVQIKDKTVSRRHLRIKRRDGNLTLNKCCVLKIEEWKSGEGDDNEFL